MSRRDRHPFFPMFVQACGSLTASNHKHDVKHTGGIWYHHSTRHIFFAHDVTHKFLQLLIMTFHFRLGDQNISLIHNQLLLFLAETFNALLGYLKERRKERSWEDQNARVDKMPSENLL